MGGIRATLDQSYYKLDLMIGLTADVKQGDQISESWPSISEVEITQNITFVRERALPHIPAPLWQWRRDFRGNGFICKIQQNGQQEVLAWYGVGRRKKDKLMIYMMYPMKMDADMWNCEVSLCRRLKLPLLLLFSHCIWSLRVGGENGANGTVLESSIECSPLPKENSSRQMYHLVHIIFILSLESVEVTGF